MKFLIDVNLSPRWCDFFKAQGWTSVHWSQVGDLRAADTQIIEYAAQNGSILFTHDLDFGTILATTGMTKISVVQVRHPKPRPEIIGHFLLTALREHEKLLEQGALLVIESARARVRVLPIHPPT